MKAYACICLRTVLAIVVLSTLVFGASKEKTLYAFQGGINGANPDAPLIADAHGNLYGTTADVGTACGLGCGTVFELVAPPSPSGTWQEVVLYSFHGPDGMGGGSGLTFDQAGNLYGTTTEGGDLTCNGGIGCGVVFELSPPGQPGGNWTEVVLHAFGGVTDGLIPASPVVFDSSGNLYGTTLGGGTNSGCGGCGTAYELSPSSGGWTETIIYTFSGGSDGAGPQGSIVLDSGGNLYGTTQGNSAFPSAAFELSPSSQGQPWTETTIGNPGEGASGLVQGADGNLYGSDSLGGTVFQLAKSNGGWTQNVIYTFNQRNGTSHPGPITIDEDLNIYLAAGFSRCGAIYKFTAMLGNAWKPSQLYVFDPRGTGGCDVFEAPTIGKWGALYGTATEGGGLGYGVVFAVAP